MKTIRRVSGRIFAVVLLAGIGSFSRPIRAQGRGEFSLSQAVHWGSVVVPSGEYSYTVDSGSQPPVVRVVQKGGSFSGLFLSQTISPVSYPGSSGIVLKRIGGDMFVTSMQVKGLGAELNFPTYSASGDVRPVEMAIPQQSAASTETAGDFFPIINSNHEKVSTDMIQKVYLSACDTVEREFKRTTPIRPRFVLHLGAAQDRLQWPGREIQLRKWDEYRFAEGIVDLALRDLVSPEDKTRLIDLAVDRAGATVNLCELKNCVN